MPIVTPPDTPRSCPPAQAADVDKDVDSPTGKTDDDLEVSTVVTKKKLYTEPDYPLLNPDHKWMTESAYHWGFNTGGIVVIGNANVGCPPSGLVKDGDFWIACDSQGKIK